MGCCTSKKQPSGEKTIQEKKKNTKDVSANKEEGKQEGNDADQ